MLKNLMMLAVMVSGVAAAQGTEGHGLLSSANVGGFVPSVVQVSYPAWPLGLYDGAFLYGMRSPTFPNVVMLMSASTLQRGDWKWCRSVFPAGSVVDAVTSDGENVTVSFRNAPPVLLHPDQLAPSTAMAAPSCLDAHLTDGVR